MGTKYFSKAWWDSRSPDQKAVFEVAALIPAARVGKGIWMGANAIRGVRPAATAISVAKRPLHHALVLRSVSDFGMLGGPLSVRTQAFLARSLRLRQKLGLMMLGYSAVNPFESIYYAQQGDWKKLAINLRWPIVGIPIWTLLTHGSGPPVSVSPTGPTSSGGPVIQQHRRQERPT